MPDEKVKYDPIKFASGCGIPVKQVNAWIEKRDAKSPLPTDATRYDLDGPIISSAEHTFWGMMEGLASPASLRKFLDEHKGEAIEVTINSPGGSCWDANAMCSDLARHDGDVTVVVSGACLSAATFFLAIPNVERIAMPDAEFMIHNCWSVGMGDYKALERVAEALKKTNTNIAKKLAKACDMETDEMLALMDAETWYTDTEALEVGLVDLIADYADMDEDEDDPEDMDDDDDDEREDKKPKAVADAEFAMFDRKALESIRSVTTNRDL